MDREEDLSDRYSSFPELAERVSTYFRVLDSYIDQSGVPTFILVEGDYKTGFKRLHRELVGHGLLPILRREWDRVILRVFSKPSIKHRSKKWLNLILLIVTVITIFVAGYWGFISTPVLKDILMKGESPYFQAASFAACLFGIIGLHELGHITACKVHGLDFSLPYFIPGPPPFGTFGAVVSLRSPPKNRDELFDTGFAGPISGFIATLLVTVISLKMGFLVSLEQAADWEAKGLIQTAKWPMYPLLFDVLLPMVRPIPRGHSLILTHVEFAAWVGALVTFLNILPIWQLDGGHISRAVLGVRGHRIASLIGLVILFATGYWFFALFLLLWMFSSGRGLAGAEPLDDVSPLSNSRKALYILALIILVLCFVELPIF
ncbi:MAG: site-2 protease family protein [Candidatus Bathyarchaeia archaeon]|nr:site-2 protease family protein [Candidatus Bathyarchaeota archaeon]